MNVLICNGEDRWSNIVASSFPEVIKLDLNIIHSNLTSSNEKVTEKLIKRMICELTVQSLLKNHSVIVQNVGPGTSRNIANAAGTLAHVALVELSSETDGKKWDFFERITPSEAIDRLKKPEPVSIVPYEPDKSLPTACIFDLDGTLAILNGRDPYDPSTCHLDGVSEPVKRMISAYDYKIGCTGRPEQYRKETEAWLNAIGVSPNELHMRQIQGTPDSIVKYEMFSDIKTRYNVEVVFEDRSSVVRMWRSIGLPCFQVDYGDF